MESDHRDPTTGLRRICARHACATLEAKLDTRLLVGRYDHQTFIVQSTSRIRRRRATVSLLLFSIGLEFSFRRLKSMGMIALVGGSLQVCVTLVVFGILFSIFVSPSTAAVLGAMVALSSTAVVLRILVDRAEIDSTRGRTALGILLFQDIAVVPLVLMVSLLSHGARSANSSNCY